MKCYQYFCMRCKKFFKLDFYTPKRCPHCFGADMVMGPYIVDEFECDIKKIERNIEKLQGYKR